MKLIYCITGSFCNHARAIEALSVLSSGNEIIPAMSEISRSTDTRFGSAASLCENLRAITGNEIITSIKQAEETVTPARADALIVSPCTGNTLAKIASGITDTTVTMCVKCQLRNRLPVIIALATNDGLSANLFNIALTVEKKNVFFVPFGQDSPDGKPTSLICDFSRLGETVAAAVKRRQIQPILL